MLERLRSCPLVRSCNVFVCSLWAAWTSQRTFKLSSMSLFAPICSLFPCLLRNRRSSEWLSVFTHLSFRFSFPWQSRIRPSTDTLYVQLSASRSPANPLLNNLGERACRRRETGEA